jgi:hypothetical protein
MGQAHIKQYKTLLVELLLEREINGGELGQEAESSYTERLWDIWRELTDEEQDEVEEWAASLNEPLDAPEDLGLVDTVPASGQMPRRRKDET